jgi:PAS domain S-box-containing protein
MTGSPDTNGELRLVHSSGNASVVGRVRTPVVTDLRFVLDNLIDVIVRVDEDGIVREVTPSSRAVLGIAAEDLIGRPLTDAVDEPDRSLVEFVLDESVVAGEALTAEVRPANRPAEPDVVLRITVRHVDLPPGREHHVVVRDVSDRRRVERELATSKHRLEALIGQTTDMVAILDDQFRFSYVNPAVEHHLGHPASFLIGRPPTDFIHVDDHVVIAENLGRVAAGTNEGVGVEYRVFRRDGSIRWFESIGRDLRDDAAIGGLLISARDVTVRHEAKVQLEQSMELLDSVMRAVATEAIVVTDRFATVIGFSRGAEELFGRRSEELVGWSAISVLHDPDDIAQLAEQVGVSTVELFMLPPPDGDRVQRHMVFVRADGSRFRGLLTVSERHDKRGEHLGFLYVIEADAAPVTRAA